MLPCLIVVVQAHDRQQKALTRLWSLTAADAYDYKHAAGARSLERTLNS